MDPVATVHVGCVIVPTIGEVGTVGAALIVPVAVEAEDVQPEVLSVTVYVYEDPGAKLDIVVVVPVPEEEPEGAPVMVQEPAGNPLRSTDPVGVVQSG